MEVDDEESSLLEDTGAGYKEDNSIDNVCDDHQLEIRNSNRNQSHEEQNRTTTTTSYSKMEYNEEDFCTQHSDNYTNDSGRTSERPLLATKCSKLIAHSSSTNVLVKLSARMKFQAEMVNASLVAGRKRFKSVNGNLNSDLRGPLSLQAVTYGVPTIQSLHTALLKHGMHQHVFIETIALYIPIVTLITPNTADNAMALIRGTTSGLRNHRAVHVSTADDLLLQIPSIPISFVSTKKGRMTEGVAKTAINFLQKSLLVQEPLIAKKLADEYENTNSIPLEKLVIFRTFTKSSSVLMAPMVSCRI